MSKWKALLHLIFYFLPDLKNCFYIRAPDFGPRPDLSRVPFCTLHFFISLCPNNPVLQDSSYIIANIKN